MRFWPPPEVNDRGMLPVELFRLVICRSAGPLELDVVTLDGGAKASSLEWGLSRPSLGVSPGNVEGGMDRVLAARGGVPGPEDAGVRADGGSENRDGAREPVLFVAVESERGRPLLPMTIWICRFRGFFDAVGGGLTMM